LIYKGLVFFNVGCFCVFGYTDNKIINKLGLRQ